MNAGNGRGGYQPRRHRRYDENYKRHAVDLTLQGTRSVQQVAEELGINPTMLHDWRRKYASAPRGPTGSPREPR